MKYLKPILLFAILFVLSCTDGMQVSQKINELLDENEITYVVIKNNNSIDNKLNKKYKVEEVVVDNQFLKVKDNYLNLEKVRSINVSKKELNIIF